MRKSKDGGLKLASIRLGTAFLLTVLAGPFRPPEVQADLRLPQNTPYSREFHQSVRPQNCTFAKWELNELDKVFQLAVNAVSNFTSENSSSFSRHSGPSADYTGRRTRATNTTAACQQLLLNVKESAMNVSREVGLIMDKLQNGKSVDLNTLENLRTELEAKNRTLQQNMDNLQRQSSEDLDLAAATANFNALLAALEIQVQGLSNQISGLQSKNQELRIRLVISSIQHNKLVEARNLYAGLKDDTDLERIVKDAFENNTEHVDKILSFVRALPQIPRLCIGYIALVKEMTRLNRLSSDQILTVDYYILEVIVMKNFVNIAEELQINLLRTRETLKRAVDSVLEAWGASIRRGDTHAIIQYSLRSIQAQGAFRTNFENNLEDLVVKAYAGNPQNMYKILKFTEKLDLYQRGLALRSLWYLLSKEKQFVDWCSFVAALKTALANEGNDELSRDLLNAVKDDLVKSGYGVFYNMNFSSCMYVTATLLFVGRLQRLF